MGWVQAVDSSYDELTEAEARALKDAGVELYIQALTALPATGLEQPPSRVISLRNATYAGLRIAGYAPISGTTPPAAELNYARRGVPDDLWNTLEFCAIDVEVPGIDILEVRWACDEIHILLPNRPVVIYTNYNTWRVLMGDPPHPPGTMLYNGYWDGSPDLDFSKLPYGGWTMDDLIGEQYSGGTYVHGQFVDRNTFWLDDPKPAPAPEPTSQLDRIEAKLDEVLRILKR